MKPIDIKDNTYVDSKKEVNDKDPKFKVGDHVRIFQYNNIFAKGCMPNWSEDALVIKKLKVQYHRPMLLMILVVWKLLEHFMKKNFKRPIKKNSEQKK